MDNDVFIFSSRCTQIYEDWDEYYSMGESGYSETRILTHPYMDPSLLDYLMSLYKVKIKTPPEGPQPIFEAKYC